MCSNYDCNGSITIQNIVRMYSTILASNLGNQKFHLSEESESNIKTATYSLPKDKVSYKYNQQVLKTILYKICKIDYNALCYTLESRL